MLINTENKVGNNKWIMSFDQQINSCNNAEYISIIVPNGQFIGADNTV